VALGTPHIAGHSLDAKAEGTRMIVAAARQHLGGEPAARPPWDPVPLLPPPRIGRVRLSTAGADDEDLAAAAARLAEAEQACQAVQRALERVERLVLHDDAGAGRRAADVRRMPPREDPALA
jgi:hypothetical protein